VLCMTVIVVVDFLYILNVYLLSVFVIVRSRNFILFLTSVSKVWFLAVVWFVCCSSYIGVICHQHTYTNILFY
jgi:hypothetical protein